MVRRRPAGLRSISASGVRRSRVLLLAVCVVALVCVFGVPGPARAGAPVIIVVTTKSDAISPGPGLCSLRAAILAANDGTFAGDCPTQGTAGQDAIYFNIGSGVPVINVGPDLPAITQALTICGNCGGGATRVKLHGHGSGTGLALHSGVGSVISSMVIDGFTDGINVQSSGVTLTRNVVGPNSGYGIYAVAGAVQIGGTTGVTPGGPCTGDCNLISGNGSQGLYLASSGTIQGNFIGTNRNGTLAKANGTGILVSSGTWTIGGTSAAAANIVSGNVVRGLDLHSCSCLIQGNLIGTDATGTAALANGSDGIAVVGFTATIGGTAAGAGNIISGNFGNGITLSRMTSATIQGNRIGTKLGGTALGNGGDGIYLAPDGNGVDDAVIGSSSAASGANTVAFNAGAGVRITGDGTLNHTLQNQVRGNSIHDNGGSGIVLEASANHAIGAPSITGIAPISGTACPGCAVDIYSDSADEGRIFEGTASADGGGQWSYPASVSGPHVTATNTDAAGNTSEFSAPVLVVTRRPDGRIRKGHGSFVGNNIYNASGTKQTKTASVARGSTVSFGISIQNDGNRADRFTIRATRIAVSGYKVRYFRGSTNITAAVVAGTYRTPSLAPAATYLITAKVTVKSTAALGSKVTRLVTIRSVGNRTLRDAVRFVAKRL